MTTTTAEQTTALPRKLTREDLRGLNHYIQRRCFMPKADGTVGQVSAAHISRIFNPEHPNTPGPGLAKKISSALTEKLGWTVSMDCLYEYLEIELGKSLDWPKMTQVQEQGHSDGDGQDQDQDQEDHEGEDDREGEGDDADADSDANSEDVEGAVAADVGDRQEDRH